MPRIPGSFDELGENIEQGVNTVGQSVKKSVAQTAQSTASQVKPAPSDFINQLYGVKEESQAEQSSQESKANVPQKVGSVAELISPIPLRSEEEINASAGSPADQFRILPQQGKTVSFGEQLTGQPSGDVTGLNTRIDPTKEMTQEERRVLDDQQKERREAIRQHNMQYVRGPLDPIKTLEERIAIVRNQKEKEEEEKKTGRRRERAAGSGRERAAEPSA